MEKCKFHTDTTEYLGYILLPSGLTMAPKKIQVIQDWPKPRKVKDIQSFLRFTNFYHCFIPEYSKITVPLMCLTRKDAPWNFDAKCHNAFNTLKSAFTTVPILTHYTPDAQLIIEMDASDYAVAAILSQ